jgi:hypothetical protein
MAIMIQLLQQVTIMVPTDQNSVRSSPSCLNSLHASRDRSGGYGFPLELMYLIR